MKQILDHLLGLQKLDSGNARASATGAGAEELRKKIPAQVLLQYDRLRTRGKKGVACVRRGVCGNCHMQVAVGLLALLRREDHLYRCENCGAYLCFVEDTPAAVVPPRNLQPARRGRPSKAAAHAP